MSATGLNALVGNGKHVTSLQASQLSYSCMEWAEAPVLRCIPTLTGARSPDRGRQRNRFIVLPVELSRGSTSVRSQTIESFLGGESLASLLLTLLGYLFYMLCIMIPVRGLRQA